jgi:hypothetical protein
MGEIDAGIIPARPYVFGRSAEFQNYFFIFPNVGKNFFLKVLGAIISLP